SHAGEWGRERVEPVPCANQLSEAGDPATPRREITVEAEIFLQNVRAVCVSATSCSDDQLDKAVTHAIKKSPSRFRSLFNKVKLLSRRSVVLLIWGGSILGPGILSYYLTAGIPEGLRYSVTSFVMTMTGILFGRFSGPVDKKLGPRVEQLAFTLWSPSDQDSWGQIMKSIPETDRLKFSQIYNQLIVIHPYLKDGGAALSRGDLAMAAHLFTNGILNSIDMFAGLHLDHPVTLREARVYLPRISRADKEALIEAAAELIKSLSAEELQDPSDQGRQRAIEFMRETLTAWIRVAE
ncbi:MAG: hypothetical protein ABL994_24695, partial [Verrucomicrobiales bacterium]